MLGSGSYGDVASAYDHLRGRCVAIKRIDDVFCNRVDAVRLVREMTILRQLQHSNTSTLLDVILPPCKDTFTTLYLVFERFDTDLHKLILSPQFLGVTHIQVLMRQLLVGLQHLHSRNVIHRDLKPANVLINEDW